MPILRKGGSSKNGGHNTHNKTLKNAGKKKQSGGAIVDVNDFDYNQIAISKHVKIDWGTAPGAPPMDCSIM